MEQPAINQDLVRRYLLGELPESEREQLEERLLTDDRFYETLTGLEDTVEDELIDEYLDGQLAKPQRDQFERVFFNTPERTQKFRLIKDLRERVPVAATSEVASQETVRPDPKPGFWGAIVAFFQNPAFGLACAAALLVALSVNVWLLVKSNRLETQLQLAQQSPGTDAELKQQLEQMRLRNDELSADLKRSEEQRTTLEQDLAALKGREGQDLPQQKTNTPVLASVILVQGVRGSGTTPTLAVPAGARDAQIILQVQDVDPQDYKRFRAIVKRSAGAEVWRNEHVSLRAKGTKASTTLTVPADKLEAGQYTVALDGETSEAQWEPLGLYTFRVAIK
jgi:TolA-binding protein